MDEEKIFYSSLYSVPTMQEDRSIQQETFAQIFERDIVNVSPRSIFNGEHSDGYYAYFKLGELGILELFSNLSDLFCDMIGIGLIIGTPILGRIVEKYSKTLVTNGWFF